MWRHVYWYELLYPSYICTPWPDSQGGQSKPLYIGGPMSGNGVMIRFRTVARQKKEQGQSYSTGIIKTTLCQLQILFPSNALPDGIVGGRKLCQLAS